MSFRKLIFILIDIVIVFGSYLLLLWVKPSGELKDYFFKYSEGFIIFIFFWIITSFFGKKYDWDAKTNLTNLNTNILISNTLALAIVATIMYLASVFFYSRFVAIGTIVMATVLEMILGSLYFHFVHSHEILPDLVETEFEKTEHKEIEFKKTKKHLARRLILPYTSKIEEILKEECGQEVYQFIIENIEIKHPRTLFLATRNRFNIENQPDNYFENIINIARVNDVRGINNLFSSVNAKLPIGGIYIGCAETIEMRKIRILKKFPPVINFIYYFFDYILKRVFPKFQITREIYFILTRGENRVLSRAEILGRLYSCGFELIRDKSINKLYYFVVHKIKQPFYDPNPNYGPLIKLKRIGKGGEIIKVYKFRTMFPYSEYLQDFVYERHSLEEGGKFKNDYRITRLGRIMRKLWIDELPMIINLVKGDVKIFGVRPLSEHYFKLYTRELRDKRIKYKPGLIPPFYVDLPKTLNEIMNSELKYLEDYEKHHLITDLRYFFKAIYNIIFKHARTS